MKKILLLLFITGQTNISLAQNVGIGTTTPDNSAVLDIASTNKGMLIPRLTTVQRNAIPTPANGLLIYNTTTSQFNQRQGGAWKVIIDNDSWTGGGTGQMFNIGDNVGINIAGPAERLEVGGNIRTTGSLNIDNTSAILQLKSGAVNKGFVQLSGDNVRLGTNSGNATGNVIVRMNGSDKIVINPAGDINLVGKITTANTGSANMLPLCYGRVSPAGIIISGSGNFSVTRVGVGKYRIYSTDLTGTSIVVVTGSISYVGMGCLSYNGYFTIDTEDNIFTGSRDVDFSFIAYQ